MNFIQDKNSVLLTENQCNEFEHAQALRLPGQYKSFLCNIVNGGKPSCKRTSISIPAWGRTHITSFLGIDADGYFNLQKSAWILGEDRLPKGMIPIADDPSGNFFFLALSGEETGKVYFFFHEEEANDPPTANNNPSLTQIANSFNEFLDSIECIEST